MKAGEAKIGQLIKTPYGLATIMAINAPEYISCIVVQRDPKYKPGSPGYKRYAQGIWLYIRGFDFLSSEVVSESR